MSMLGILGILSAYRRLTRRGAGTGAAQPGPRGQRGQALLEFTMFFLFMMFLVAGIVDIGGLLSDHVSLEYAARTGARTASVLSNKSADADCAIIGAIDTALVNLPNVRLTQVTIYQADASGQSTGLATVYQAPVTCNGTTLSRAPSPDDYPPSARDNTIFTENSIGVRLDYTYTFQFPLLFIGTFTASDQAVFPANPITVPTFGP